MKVSGRILLGDDDEGLRKLFNVVLKSEGYQVDLAENGQQVLQKVQESEYDLLLVDLRMPGLNGLEVLRRIKKTSPRTLVIIIACHMAKIRRRERGIVITACATIAFRITSE